MTLDLHIQATSYERGGQHRLTLGSPCPPASDLDPEPAKKRCAFLFAIFHFGDPRDAFHGGRRAGSSGTSLKGEFVQS